MSVAKSFVIGSALAIFAFFAFGGQKSPNVPTPHAIKPHSKHVLMPLPSHGFDPTEFSYPVSVLSSLGYDVIFATPTGAPSAADPLVLNTTIFKPPAHILELYDEMRSTASFLSPATFDDLPNIEFDGLVLVGGHHPGMTTYLDDERVHHTIRRAFEEKKVIGMICHGVLAALRTSANVDWHGPEQQSILSARNASFTFLPKYLERTANTISENILGIKDYQLSTTHGQYVEDEIEKQQQRGANTAGASKGKSVLVHSPMDLLAPLFPGGPRDHRHAFVVVDEHNRLVSARFWGDAYLFSLWMAQLMQNNQKH